MNYQREVIHDFSAQRHRPDFEAETTEGRIKFHDWIGDFWAVLSLTPKDFTPVCTTELGYMAKIKPEFDARGVKIIGLSVDPLDRHSGLGCRHRGNPGLRAQFPDDRRRRLQCFEVDGMLPAPVSGDPTKRTPADNQTVRNVFVIGPDKKVKLILIYPMTTGRNFDEVLRVVEVRRELHGEEEGRDAGELEEWRGRDHRRLSFGRGRPQDLSAGLEVAQADIRIVPQPT